MSSDNTIGVKARALLLQRLSGVLSTHSKDVDGYPFGSVVPYCVGTNGHPVLLISDLAQHTKNLRADSRASLTVLEPDDGDVQTVGRVTCIGDVEPIEDGLSDTAQRYFRFFPEAEQYHEQLDFAFYRLKIFRAGYIGGFGGLHWIEPEEFLYASPFSPESEQDIVNHMNEDHVEAMRTYCRSINSTLPSDFSPTFSAVDGEGFYLRVGARRLRFTFSQAVANPMDVRKELVALIHRK